RPTFAGASMARGRLLRFVCLILACCWWPHVGAAADREDYVWNQVAIGGGGYVTGIVLHPTEPDLAYIRTDVGGAYRWSEVPDGAGRYWILITDNFPLEDFNFYGIESIAVDPSDPDVVYIAAG